MIGCEFPSLAAEETGLHSAAKAAGLSLAVQTKKPNATNTTQAVYRCCKGRKYVSQSAAPLDPRPGGGGVWVVEGVKSDKSHEHNHLLSAPGAFSRYRKEAIMKLEDSIISRWNTGTQPMRILLELQAHPDPDVQAITRHDLRNLFNRHRQQQLAGRTLRQ